MTKKSSDKFALRRVRTSFITTVISISLVLFMLGILGSIILYAKKISENVKENIGFSVILKENAKEADIIFLQRMLNYKRYVKHTDYITKEKAALELKNDLGEDFVKFLGYNPLLPTIEVKLKADYANPESMKYIEMEMLKNKNVKEILYQKSLLTLINENINKISLIILAFSSLLLFISVVLINNTIRLSVYSKRFLIKSMLLIGATQRFVRRPFIINGILEGIYGSILAIFMLIGIFYIATQQIPELDSITDIGLFLLLFGIIIVLGVLISWVSNYLALRKYLNIKTDYLYYQ